MSKEDIYPLSEQDTAPLNLPEFQKTEQLVPPPYTRKDRKTVAARRVLAKTLQSRIALPIEKVPTAPDAVERAQELRQEGYGFIVPYSHADRRGPVDVMTTLISLGKGFEDAVYLGPLALHQEKGYIDFLSKHADVPLMTIVTPASIEYFKNKHEQDPSLLKRAADIFHRDHPVAPELRPNQGLREYADQAGDVLADDHGIVFVAPQGGRRSELGQPAGRAVEMLINSAKRKGAGKIAVWPMGILLQSGATADGMNRGKMVNVTYSAPLTLEQLEQQASEHGQTIDREVFTEFAKLLPQSYVNPRSNIDSR